jgi:hypothetical protein
MRKKVLICLVMTIVGCESRRVYRTLAPDEVSGQIGVDAAGELRRDGVLYTIAQVDGRVVVRFINTTGLTLTLASDSAAVDASGRRVSLGKAVLAGGDSGEFFLPPRPAAARRVFDPLEAAPPVGGFDQGGIYSGRHGSTPWLAIDRFDWPRGGEVSLLIRWQADANRFIHDFRFARP